MITLTVTLHRKKILAYSIVTILIFLLGFFIGGSFQKNIYSKFLSNSGPIRDNSGDFEYINPLLGINSPEATTINFFVPIKEKLVSILNENESSGKIGDGALYFRDLNSALWFGIEADTNFVTASLFKLPVALAAYRQGENNPQFFTQKVIYTQLLAQRNSPEHGAASSTLVVGQGYYIKDIIKEMLINSDNGAKDLLVASIEKKYLDDVFAFSELIEPDFQRQYNLSPKNYSIFFRILYSATYLSKKDSNELLGLMTTSIFTEGLVKGVDSSVPVSHKYGIYTINKATEKSQAEEELHDCGIIYHPRHPYILCIMTEGKNDANLRAVIAEISQAVYENIGDEYDK